MRLAGAIRLWLGAAIAATSLLTSASAAGADARVPGRTFTGAYTSFPDYLDPQLSYTAEGWTAMYDTYIPLLTYRHADGKAGAEVIPGLAKALPKITDGGRTYTLFLRPGLRYSDGTAVHASDFKTTVERMFKLHSGGTGFYTDIVGAPALIHHIQPTLGGIKTDNATGKIVIHLTRPRGTFSNELALLFVAPVPRGTPIQAESTDPPPATGPYAITHADYSGWTYERNPEWAGTNGVLMPQIPAGQVDRIAIEVIPDQLAQVNGLRSGKLDWLFDPPPPDVIGELEAGRDGMQLRAERTINTFYFWLNTRTAPFDDLKVRQAVNYAVDPAALRRIYAGQITPTHQILPPAMPGYRRFDLYPHDMAKARRLIREADPADRDITVWTDSENPNSRAGAYYKRVLQKLGFHVHLKVVSTENYFYRISLPKTANLDTGFGTWYEDYPHPNDFFEPLMTAKPGSYFGANFSQLVSKYLDRRVAQLGRRPGPIDDAAYAGLDLAAMKLAPIVPYGNRVLDASFSRNVDLRGFIWNPTFESDFTSFRFGRGR